MFRIYRRRFRRLITFWPLLFIALGTAAVILYGRGYRPDLKENTLKSTGLVSTTSDPTGAQVFVDGKLTTATNNSFNIDPGWYTVKISQEGYISWEKRLRVQGEVVTRADAFLFPTNPSLSPLTNTGIERPLLSPDGIKIAYTIPLNNDLPSPRKAGLWFYEMAERPLGLNRDPRQLGISDNQMNFSTAQLIWSPDSSQIMVEFGKSVRLYNIGRSGDFVDATASLESILLDWEEAKRTKERQKLAAFKQEIVDVATSSARIISFSPDESKILYEATSAATLPRVLDPPLIGTNPTEEKRQIEPGKLYVYDSREDKNFFVMDKKELPQPPPSPITKGVRPPSPSPKSVVSQSLVNLQPITYNLQLPVHWFPTNRHLVLTLPGKIDILEYDRTNWVTIYSGPLIDGFLAIWPNTSRIIVMTNLNPGVSTLPNLYTVNLR